MAQLPAPMVVMRPEERPLEASGTEPGPRGAFLRPFLALTSLGLLGVFGGLPVIVGLLRAAPELPLGVLAAISLIQPGLLVAASAALGLLLTPRLGLVSHTVTAALGGRGLGRKLRLELPPALLAGLLVGVLTVLLELVFRPWVGPALEALSGPRSLLSTLSAVLYGGISEEIMTRWGLLTLVAAGLARLTGRGRPGRASGAVMWPAILIVALIFGALHLPALSLAVGLTPLLVVRTLLLDASPRSPSDGFSGAAAWRQR
jgi:membrane protease YdiL (CAAX protease family)